MNYLLIPIESLVAYWLMFEDPRNIPQSSEFIYFVKIDSSI